MPHKILVWDFGIPSEMEVGAEVEVMVDEQDAAEVRRFVLECCIPLGGRMELMHKLSCTPEVV